jgi:GntR family transcriptional regulator/MocR family aminotransferase
MSLARRLSLLDWANQNDGWILEDDYSSEYRYAGRPLSALQGLAAKARVIYAGTFSKVLFPALRLGYLVVPPNLIRAFVETRFRTDIHSPTMDQAVLADFMTEGHFVRHLRRMRKLYRERQAILVAAAREQLAGLLEIQPVDGGLHLMGWLPRGVDDVEAWQRALDHGVVTQPLSACCLEPFERGGLLLGFAGVDAAKIHKGVQQLAAALKPPVRPRQAQR